MVADYPLDKWGGKGEAHEFLVEYRLFHQKGFNYNFHLQLCIG